MPEQNTEFLNHIHNDLKRTESIFINSIFINHIKTIIKQDSDIIKNEELLFIELQSFCSYLVNENIKQKLDQNYKSYQENPQLFSESDEEYLNNLYFQSYKILKKYEHFFTFPNFFDFYININPEEKTKISKFIHDRLEEENFETKSWTELNLKARSVRNNDFWNNVETKIKKIAKIAKKLQNVITDIFNENNLDINVINEKIANQVGIFIEKKIKKQFENIKLEDARDYISYSFLTKYHQTSDKELCAQKVEDELNFQLLNDFYQKYVKNSKDLVDYYYYSKDIEVANIQYINAKLKIIEPFISSSESTLTVADFLEEDDKNQYITKEDKIELQNLKAKRDDLIKNISIEMYKIKDSVQIFLNKEILSEENKEKLEQKKYLQSCTTIEELNLTERSFSNNDFWNNVETKIENIKSLEKELHNNITNIIKNGLSINFIDDSIIIEVNQFIEKLKQQFEILNFQDFKTEDKLNFPVLNDFYQKYVENSKNLVDYYYYYKAIEAANTDYIHERLKIIQACISSSKSTLTVADFLEEDDKNQYITKEDKIKLQNLKAKRDDLIKNISIEMYKIKDSVQIFLNKEILSEENKEKLEQKKYLQSCTTIEELNLTERSFSNNDFWNNVETKIENIKSLEKELHNNITNIIKNGLSINFIDDSIIIEVNQFIEKLKQQFEILNFQDFKTEDELNFQLLNEFYQKYVKNSKGLVFNYQNLNYKQEKKLYQKLYMDNRAKIIEPYINDGLSKDSLLLTNENDFLEKNDETNQYITEEDKNKLKTFKTERDSLIQKKAIEISKIKDSVHFFLNKEILSEKNKQKLVQKLEKKLQSMETKEYIEYTDDYFQVLENNFFIPLNEALNNFEDDVRTINSNYKDQLKELNKRQNDNTNSEVIDNEKKKIFQIMKNQRAQALSNFEYDNRFRLEKLYDITTYNPTWLLTIKNHLFASQLFTYEKKNKYSRIVENIKELKATIEKHKAEVTDIFNEDKVNEIYEHVQNIETKKFKDKISKLLTTGVVVEKTAWLDSETDSSELVVTKDTKELSLTLFANKDSGEPITSKVVDKLKVLEDVLLINDVLNNIDIGIHEWYKGINNLFDANEKIKNLKLFKSLTTVNKTQVVNKNTIFIFQLFPDDNANRRAQFIINTHQRETNIKDYLAISGIRKHTFEDTIGQFIKFKNESIWEKMIHWKNRSINWLKQATHINQKSNWLKKTLLLLVSPITIPYGAIKSAYGRLCQQLVPRSNLKNDFKYIEKLKTELNYQCDAIRIKYAELMAIPFEKRSIFSAKKTDNDYLKQANAEFKKITNKFLGILQEEMKPYESYAKKQDSKYYSDGRTMQKIKTIVDDFTKNPIKDDNNNDSKYQFTNIEELDIALKNRVKQPDYKQQNLSSSIETMIKCANGLSDDLIDTLTKPVFLINS